MGANFEPFVQVHTKYADTPSNALASLNGLICAAPVVITNVTGSPWNSPDKWYELYGRNEKLRFIKECDNIQGIIRAETDETVVNIYNLLGHMSVLVLRANPAALDNNGRVIPEGHLKDRYGDAGRIAFSGYLGPAATKAGNTKSLYLDNRLNHLDKYFTIQKKIDIQSTQWSDLVDKIEDLGTNLLTYRYIDQETLEFSVAFSSSRFPMGITGDQGILKSIGITDGLQGSVKSFCEAEGEKWNFAIVRTNLIGLTETKDYKPEVNFTITSKTKDGNKDIIKVKVHKAGVEFDQLPENTITIENGRASIDSTILGLEVILSPNYDYDSIEVKAKNKGEYSFNSLLKVDSMTGNGNNNGAQVDILAGAKLAITKLKDFDEGYRIDFLFDSGIEDASIKPVMADMAEELNALAVGTYNDLDASEQNKAQLRGKVDSSSSSYLYRIGPKRKVSFGTYSKNLSLGVDYLSCVARNKANLQEFAPVFHFTNGYVADGLLTKDYNKTERKNLLEYHVNTVKRDKFRAISYINNNFTANPSEKSLGNEEQIVRLANRLGWDIKFLMEQFLGRLDIKATAQSVKEEIKIYYNNTFGPEKYSPENLEVICDETNNRFGDSELAVTVNIYVGRSLKKIEVFNQVLPLTSYE